MGARRQYQRRLAKGAVGWNTNADEYADRHQELAAILAGDYAPQSGYLLELGCGCGNVGLWLAAPGFAVRGIDIAPTAVAVAQENADADGLNAVFCVGNVVELAEFADDSFDFVYDSHLIHCIIGDDRAKLFANVRRVLRPGGYFLVSTMCYSEITNELKFFDPATGCTIWEDGTATRYIGHQQDLLNEVAAAGFTHLAHALSGDEGSTSGGW